MHKDTFGRTQDCDTCRWAFGVLITCPLHKQMNDYDPADKFTWSEDVFTPTHQARIEVTRREM